MAKSKVTEYSPKADRGERREHCGDTFFGRAADVTKHSNTQLRILGRTKYKKSEGRKKERKKGRKDERKTETKKEIKERRKNE